MPGAKLFVLSEIFGVVGSLPIVSHHAGIEGYGKNVSHPLLLSLMCFIFSLSLILMCGSRLASFGGFLQRKL